MRLVAEQLGGSLHQSVVKAESSAPARGRLDRRDLRRRRRRRTATPWQWDRAGPILHRAVATSSTLGYDPAKDFVPVGAVAWAPQVLVVRKSFPASTFPAEMLAYAKQPGVHLKAAARPA